MKKSDIQNFSSEKLVAYLENLGGRTVKEVNFGRGTVTKSTEKELEWTIQEIAKRFNLDIEKIQENIIK